MPELSTDTRMALMRTRLAFERTLMSWVRTAVSLITFGFTLFKAYQYAQHQDTTAASRGALGGVHHFALGMLGIGIAALLLALLQHLRHVAVLRQLDSELPILSIAAVVAGLFVALGGWALFAILV